MALLRWIEKPRNYSSTFYGKAWNRPEAAREVAAVAQAVRK